MKPYLLSLLSFSYFAFAVADVTLEYLPGDVNPPNVCPTGTTNVKTRKVVEGNRKVTRHRITVAYRFSDVADEAGDGNIETVDLRFVEGNYEVCSILLRSGKQGHSLYTFEPCVTSYEGMMTPLVDGFRDRIANVQFCVQSTAGGLGDPHITPWHQPMFDFHGQCDLVFLKTPQFGNGKGLEVQIRTEIVDKTWSYIKAVAVKVGDKVLEIGKGMEEDPYHHHEGETNGELPSALGDYPVQIWHNPDPDHVCQRAYRIKLAENTDIIINVNALFMSISIPNHDSDVFGGSVGLMGDYDTGAFLGLDGDTEFTDMDAFGQDWQVQGESLFSTVQAPQYPAMCIMPEVTARRLRSGAGKNGMTRQLAQELCQGYGEDCVFDVMMTGDVRARRSA